MNDLHDIVLPEPVGWMPSTAGWYALFVVAAVLGVWTTWVAFRRYRANRYRRAALAEMNAIEAALRSRDDRAAAVASLARLVKRVALCFAPRATIAELSGDAWLAFLDETYGGTGFTQGAGRLLPTLSYGSPRALNQITDQQVSELVQLVRRWIRSHHVRV
jgi:hypothetical protein